jgi:hypothetical protein
MKIWAGIPFLFRFVCSVALVQVGAVFAVEVKFTTYPAMGTLTTQPSHTTVSNYGIKPAILLNPNDDNSYDVAYHLSGSSKIQILNFSKDDVLLKRLEPDSLAGAKGLVGMTRITDDGSFAIGYSKDSPVSGDAYEFWVTRVSSTGQKIFSTLIFGDMDKKLVDAKGEPGTFSSGRLAFNKVTKKVGLYVGHTMKWPDSVRHQAGYVGFISLEGVNLSPDGWYSSHNFDQRLLIIGSDYYTLAHGDAYPRALGFAKWADGGITSHTKGKQVFNKSFLIIPGGVGDNKTSTQLGNVIPLGDGTFGVVFTTANGRNNFDIGYRQLSATGDTLGIHWITNYPATTLAIFPRISKFGNNVLLLWEEIVGTVNNGIQTTVVAPNGTVVTATSALADKSIRLSPYYEVITLPNGNIMWANQKGNDSISVFKIPAPATTIFDKGKSSVSRKMALRWEKGQPLLVTGAAGINTKGTMIRFYRPRHYPVSLTR